MLEIKIKTWRCGVCNYSQDFEPTQENMNIHFNNDKNFRLVGLKANQCPSCALKKNLNLLTKETDENKKIKMTIREKNDEIEEETVVDGKITEVKKRKVKEGEYTETAKIQELKDKYEDK